MQLRYCNERGLLVGGKFRLTTDVCEYYCGVSLGCNNLRCTSCGEKVRIGPPGVHPRPELNVYGSPLHVALLSTDRWLDLPFMTKDDDATWETSRRLYVCKCSDWELSRDAPLLNDRESNYDPNVPWECAGHPTPTLPLALGELTIADDSDWTALVMKILGGVCPRHLQFKVEGPAQWLAWLYGYLLGLPAAERLSAALAAHVDDTDPLTVGRVNWFFQCFPRAPGIERVLMSARAGNTLFAGTALPEAGTHTRWNVLHARLMQRSRPNDAVDKHAVDVFRELALKPASPDVVADALGDNVHRDAFDADDLSWIAHHLVAIETAGPGRWKPAMGLLVHWGRAKRDLAYLIAIGGVALIESGRVPLADIAEWLKKTSYSSDEWALVLQASLDKHASP